MEVHNVHKHSHLYAEEQQHQTRLKQTQLLPSVNIAESLQMKAAPRF